MLSGCGPARSAIPIAGDKEPLIVAVVNPSARTLSRQVRLTGEFRAWQQASLHAKVSGYLRTLSVDVGSKVKAGDLIGIVEAPELEAERLEAQASVAAAASDETRAAAQINSARSRVSLARSTQERLAAVNRKEPGLVAGQEIDEARTRLEGAIAELDSAEAALSASKQRAAAARARLKRVETMLEYCRITAPFAGTITRRFADPGNMIQAGVNSQSQALPLVQLSDVSRLRLAVVVPESDVPQLQLGSELEIHIPALARAIAGRLARFTQSVAVNSRTMEAEVDVANPSSTILPGMVADVTVRTHTPRNVLTLPVQAISNRGGQSYVLVVSSDGTVNERRIETGLEGGSHVEIRSGLITSDQIVVGSKTLVQPGQKVQAKAETAG